MGAFWSVASVQLQKTQLYAKQTFPGSGPTLLLSSGQDTGIPVPSGCVPPSVKLLRLLTPLWSSCPETFAQAPGRTAAQNLLMWSSGRDFPLSTPQVTMKQSPRLATPLWRELVQQS